MFLSFHAGFSSKDAGFFLFPAYLFKSNKRESISILGGFNFDSRLVWDRTISYTPKKSLEDRKGPKKQAIYNDYKQVFISLPTGHALNIISTITYVG